MFLGEFEYKIDEKGRVPIPPKFRGGLKDGGMVVATGPEKNIVAYSTAGWNKLAATLDGSSIAASKLRRLKRSLFAGAFTVNIDRQGRIALPPPLREYAGIEDEVIIAGVNTYFELWDKEQWASEKAASQEQAWQIIESLERH
ncbi:MAG: division/cell wall cluster transcriptional repressor MraZ [Dehalococcoidales bacterium]|nr:division/cell wall cluster transcriptional repressor MraZ [Dehalococcoidales bacterium]